MGDVPVLSLAWEYSTVDPGMNTDMDKVAVSILFVHHLAAVCWPLLIL